MSDVEAKTAICVARKIFLHFEESLDVALDVAEGFIRVSSSLHGLVAGQRADLGLGLALDLVSDAVSVGLGISESLGSVGLRLLGGAVGSEIRETEGLADGLLGASHVGVGSVGESFSHFDVFLRCLLCVGG